MKRGMVGGWEFFKQDLCLRIQNSLKQEETVQAAAAFGRV
jgi:hypothetical protein